MKIKDCYEVAKTCKLEGGKPYLSFQGNLSGISILQSITVEDCAERTSYSESYERQTVTLLEVGDIIFHTREEKHAKVINSLPKEKIYASKVYVVIRLKKDIPKDTYTIPSWAIVITARRSSLFWDYGALMYRIRGNDILNYKFDKLPKENPKGIQLLESAQNLIALERKQIKLMEEFHNAIAYRMLEGKPLSDKKPEALKSVETETKNA